MPQVKATVLGAGAMGMALGVVLSSNGFSVTFWDIEERVVEGIAKRRKNPRSLSNIALPASVSSEFSLARAVLGADVVVFAVASEAVREVARQVANHLTRTAVVVVASKGLEAASLKTMVDVLEESLPGSFKNQIMALSGPTLAPELADKKPTAAMLASKQANAYSKRALAALNNQWFRVYETRDSVGVELAGVAKHTLAICAGIMDGLSLGENARAWVLTDGFREASRLIWKLGGAEETVYGLAGFGDTIATSFAAGSRNRRLGELLGKGKTPKQAASAIGETTEGILAAEAFHKLALRERLRLPVLEAVYDVVSLKKKADKVFRELLKGATSS